MSRAFVKEDAPEPDENPPERPVSPHPNYVTPRGARLLQAEEGRLVAALTNFSGVQADPARRDAKRKIERDLRYVRTRLEAAIPVDSSAQPKSETRFGAAVTLRADDGRPFKLRVVGEDEADSFRDEDWNLIAWPAPLSRALMGLKAGDAFEWDLGGGTRRWTVAAVAYDG